MKVLALHTGSYPCEGRIRSLMAAGYELYHYIYEGKDHSLLPNMMARGVAPDLIVYIGISDLAKAPPPDILRALDRIAPLVHVCDDASDPPWWPLLEFYNDEKCFTVQVGVDGNRSPIAKFCNGLCTLSVSDNRPFGRVPWGSRHIKLGFVGGRGYGERVRYMDHLIQHAGLQFYEGPGATNRSFDAMADLMSYMKVVWNHPMCGSGGAIQAKTKIVEIGYAGACLLELRGSPVEDFFVPDVDFLTYGSPEEAVEKIARTTDTELREMAERYEMKVMRNHYPLVFWNRVLNKIREVRQ